MTTTVATGTAAVAEAEAVNRVDELRETAPQQQRGSSGQHVARHGNRWRHGNRRDELRQYELRQGRPAVSAKY